jgi:glycosyltransferase involved in cell wall biosynthesis
MRILQINNCHYRRGGADVVYLNTGELLEKNGHEVFYFSQKNINNFSANTTKYFVDEVNFFEKSLLQKIIFIPDFFASQEAKQKLEKLINDIQPDIAHIHLYKGVLTSSILLILKKKKIPVIITLHDFGLLCPHNIMLDGKMKLCMRCITGSPLNCIIHKCNRNNFAISVFSSLEYIYHANFVPFAKYFNSIITVSNFSRGVHQQSKKIKKEFYKLYNFFPDLKETAQNREKGDYFIYFGRLSKEKGLDTLLRAWGQQTRKLKLKLIGTGEIYDQLVKEKLPANIDLLGYKTGLELQRLINMASFTISPSEVYENNPLSIIESYALGKPVIGANVGGIPEIIENGKTGFLFEMKNVEDLSNKISMAEEMSEKVYCTFSDNARKFAEIHFNPETHYNELIRIYQETINSYKNV